jgi:hypothetical protein
MPLQLFDTEESFLFGLFYRTLKVPPEAEVNILSPTEAVAFSVTVIERQQDDAVTLLLSHPPPLPFFGRGRGSKSVFLQW